jgi:hypothetical protein
VGGEVWAGIGGRRGDGGVGAGDQEDAEKAGVFQREFNYCRLRVAASRFR